MKNKIKEFTTIIPFWNPYITPVQLETATPEQLDALQVTPSNTKVGEYVLVLAHDPTTLKHRTPLFNGIMYSRNGLSLPETELSAVATSVTNRCIYCTAVHASRYNELTKTTSDMENILDTKTPEKLDPRKLAIFNFSKKLSVTPPTITGADLQSLRDNDLQIDEVLDIILSSSIFAWANRLMHPLGEPLEHNV